MIGKLTEGMSANEAKQLLQDMAEDIYEGQYYRPLSQEEIEERQSGYAQNDIKIFDLKEQLGVIKEEFKGKINPLAETNKILLNEIRTRQQSMNGTLYTVFNHEDEVVEFYNDSGQFLHHRKMNHKEKGGSGNVFAMVR